MKQFQIKFNDQDYKVNFITDRKEASQVSEFLRKSDINNFGIDIETGKLERFKKEEKAGLDPYLSFISLLQLYDGKNTVYVFDVVSTGIEFFNALTGKNFVAHYAMFEIKHLTYIGFPNLSIGCSMLSSILVDRAEKTDFKDTEFDEEEDDTPHWKGYGLDAIIGRLFEIKIDKKWQLHDWSLRPIEPEALVYAALDSILTYKITEIQFPKLLEYKMLAHYKILKSMQHVIAKMELNGIKIDTKKHLKLIYQWDATIEELQKKCKKYFGDINLNSSKQLNDFYIKRLKKQFPELTDSTDYNNWKKTKTGQLGFDKNALATLQYRPEIKALLEYKKTAKLISTYGHTLADQINPCTRRIHCSFTLGETRTGRLSSREPNLQNLPRESSMRDVFIPDPGKKLIIADFNQIELRVAGEVSNDPVIKGAYAKGDDLHSIFAAKMYKVPISKVTKEQRQIAKSANFGAIYGMGANKFITYTLASTNGAVKLSYDEAKHTIDSLWSLYRVYGTWCTGTREMAETQGFIRTPLGKMRRLHPKEVYTKAPNTVVQGGAFEVMACAMIDLNFLLGNDAKIVNSVHDEVIVECDEDKAELVKKIVETSMVKGMKQVFPKANVKGLAVAKICDSWGEK